MNGVEDNMLQRLNSVYYLEYDEHPTQEGTGYTLGGWGSDKLWDNQGNLNGESVVAAILPSRMDVSYCTSGFFVAKPAK